MISDYILNDNVVILVDDDVSIHIGDTGIVTDVHNNLYEVKVDDTISWYKYDEISKART